MSELHKKILHDKIAYLRSRGHTERGIAYMSNAEIDNWYAYYHENPDRKSPHETMLERHKRQKAIKELEKRTRLHSW